MNESNDFQIELGQTVRRHAEQKTSPLRDRSLCAVPYDHPESHQTPIFIAESVMRSIEALAAKDREREVGGVLLGGFFRGDNGSSFIEVSAFIEAKAAKGTDVSLTFTHETWEQISAEQTARGGSAVIVGWYHSHPALGVFMSQDDEFIHSGFFRDPWQIAVVVDPIYHNWGCFKWQDGSLADSGGFYVFGEKRSAKRLREYAKSLSASRQPTPRSASAGADRRQRPARTAFLWVVVALLIAAQALTAFILFSRPEGRTSRIDNMRAARDLLSASDISGGSQFLRQELLDNPRNSAARREMDRLADLASSAPKASDEAYDRTNFVLLAADKAAGASAEYGEARADSDWKIETAFDDDEKLAPELAASDPVKDALRAYEKARTTHAPRLARAELVSKTLSGAERGNGKTWYEAAVVRVRQEPLRMIAYGRTLGEPEYLRRYTALIAEDRKIVDLLYSDLKKARQDRK